MKNFVNANKWSLEGRLGLELFVERWGSEYNFSHGFKSTGCCIQTGGDISQDKVYDFSGKKFEISFNTADIFGYQQAFLDSNLK